MATHQIARPQGPVLYQFKVLEEFSLMIPQDNGTELEQPYKVGKVYYVREGNAWLDDKVSGAGGLVWQGKVEVI